MFYWQLWAAFWESWAKVALAKDEDVTKNLLSDEEHVRGELYSRFFEDPKMRQRAREEFLANVNHDLRTPLNAVIGFAQIIENEMFGKVSPQYLEYAKHIQESGYDLLAKIESLVECPVSLGTLEENKRRARVHKKSKKLVPVE